MHLFERNHFNQSQNIKVLVVFVPLDTSKKPHVCHPVFLSVEMGNKHRVTRWFGFESQILLEKEIKQEEKQKTLKPHCFNENWEPVTKKDATVNWQLLRGSPGSTRGSTASPQRGVVELDPQQVPHAGLGWVVDDVLVVQEGVPVVAPHPGPHPGAHRHRHAVPGGTRERKPSSSWVLLGS